MSINNCRSGSGLVCVSVSAGLLHPDSSSLHLQLVMEVLLLDTGGQRQVKSLLLIFVFVGNTAGQCHSSSTLKDDGVYNGRREICSRHHSLCCLYGRNKIAFSDCLSGKLKFSHFKKSVDVLLEYFLTYCRRGYVDLFVIFYYRKKTPQRSQK